MPEFPPIAEARGGTATHRRYVTDPGSLPEQLVRRWRALRQADSSLQSPFLDPAYVQAVAACREGVRLAVLERDGAPCGFFPFQYADRLHRWLGAAEPVGAHMTDAVGVVAAPDCGLTPLRLLRSAGLRYFRFTHLCDAQARLGLRGDREECGLAIDLRRGPEAYWAALGASNQVLIEDSERRRRRLREAHGPVRFVFSAGEVAGELHRLIDAKRVQYRRTGAADPLGPTWTRRLLQRLAESDAAECQGLLSTLHAGETWVASHFGLRSGALLHYWFPIYNPALARFAPGRLLLMSIIDAAPAQGISLIERGVGTQPHKREFANLSRSYYRGAWHEPGPRAFVARTLASLNWRIGALRQRRPRQFSGEEMQASRQGGNG